MRTEFVLASHRTDEARWQDRPELAGTELPRYVGRTVAALAADPDVMQRSGGVYRVSPPARELGPSHPVPHCPRSPLMPHDIPLRCTCGALRGVARHVAPRTLRSVCYCDDCQTYAHFLGRTSDVLDAHGGTEVVPIAPCDLAITEGSEHLRCVRLGPDGMYRWYAGCCRTPIANTMPSARVPFAGVVHSIFDLPADPAARDAALGPVRSRVQGRWAIAPTPPGVHPSAPLGFILRAIGFVVAGFARGRHRPSPFFTPEGQPVAEPSVLAPAVREALRKRCGPHPSASA